MGGVSPCPRGGGLAGHAAVPRVQRSPGRRRLSTRRDPRVPLTLAELSDRLGVAVDAELLERALTHRSYAYEHGGLPTNERLEFLGESVL
ncbi:MAG TPA: hypothetical protein VK895_02100, partial [Jiangellaceae bacterium]|nr:hypothetical protein [Jiangellaceae bacterium]